MKKLLMTIACGASLMAADKTPSVDTPNVEIKTPQITSCEKPNFCGFYTGVSLGVNAPSASQKLKVERKRDKFLEHRRDFGSRSSFVGGLFMGYGQVFSGFYLGGEGYFNLFNNDLKRELKFENGRDKYILNTKISNRDSFGGKFRVGYVCNRWMPYVGLNVETTKINVKGVLKKNNVVEIDKHKTRRVYGLGPVLGCEWSANRNIFMRVEYNYANHQQVSISSDDDKNTMNFKLNNHRFNLGVGYRF